VSGQIRLDNIHVIYLFDNCHDWTPPALKLKGAQITYTLSLPLFFTICLCTLLANDLLAKASTSPETPTEAFCAVLNVGCKKVLILASKVMLH